MLDEITFVESDDELSYIPTPPKQQNQVVQAKTIQEKREFFRFQIRKEQIEEQLEKKRMWFLPKQRFIQKEGLPCISAIFQAFKVAYSENNVEAIDQNLHILANIIDDKNRIHSLYLTQRNFIQFRNLFLEETYFMDCFIIYSQLTQDEEFYNLNIDEIKWTIQQSLQIISNSFQNDLNNLILGYLANVASKLPLVQQQLLENNALKLCERLLKPQLQNNILYLIQTVCTKIPEQFKYQLAIGMQLCIALEKQNECLQTLYIIIKQATIFYEDVDYSKIMTLLFSHIYVYLQDEQEFEAFYSALVQLKHLSDYNNLRIVNLFLQFKILDIIIKLIAYRYQKIRTAGLYMLQNLCKAGHKIIDLIFQSEELLKKLINILTSDKPVNQSLVLKAIIHILKYGSDTDCAKLLDLGLAVQLKAILQANEAYILLQGIECTSLIMNFGLHFQKLNIQNPILNKLYQNQIIDAIDKLQQHPNEEVFEYAQKFINTYFKVEEQE